MNGRQLVETAVDRVPLGGHDGRSGSALERIVLPDGTRLVAKRSTPSVDLGMRASGDTAGRERRLWATGVLDRLPAGVGHAIVDAWRQDGDVVVLMRDVSEHVPGWNRRLSRARCRRLLRAVASVHEAFRAAPLAGLCPLDVRLTLLSPRRMAPLTGGANPLPALVLRGWERFAELAPRPVADVVLGLLDHPAPLLAELSRLPHTLIHGDLWLVNLALEPERLTLLDWGLASWAPPAVEIASFLAGNASQVRASRDQLVDDARDIWADWGEGALHLGLVAGLLELGWNKALDAAEHADAAKRAAARTDLEWWLRAAAPGLAELSPRSKV